MRSSASSRRCLGKGAGLPHGKEDQNRLIRRARNGPNVSGPVRRLVSLGQGIRSGADQAPPASRPREGGLVRSRPRSHCSGSSCLARTYVRARENYSPRPGCVGSSGPARSARSRGRASAYAVVPLSVPRGRRDVRWSRSRPRLSVVRARALPGSAAASRRGSALPRRSSAARGLRSALPVPADDRTPARRREVRSAMRPDRRRPSARAQRLDSRRHPLLQRGTAGLLDRRLPGTTSEPAGSDDGLPEARLASGSACLRSVPLGNARSDRTWESRTQLGTALGRTSRWSS